MNDVCFMCGNQPAFTMEVWGRKERICKKCILIIIRSLDRKAGFPVPVMIKEAGKWKAVRIGEQIIELSAEQIADLERTEGK